MYRARIEPINGLTSLGDLIQHTNMKQNLSVICTDGLGDKNLLVFGLIENAPRFTLEAIADLFGLELVSTKQGGLLLRRPKVKTISEIDEIPSAIRKICPPALLRAVGDKASIASVSQVLKMEPSERMQQQMKNYRNAATISNLRLSQMSSLISSELKKSFNAYNEANALSKRTGDKRLTFEQLKPDNQKAFAQFLLLPALRVVRDRFTGTMPEYVSKFNDLYFSGKESTRNGEKWFKITLQSKNSPGDYYINALTIEGRVE